MARFLRYCAKCGKPIRGPYYTISYWTSSEIRDVVILCKHCGREVLRNVSAMLGVIVDG